MNFSPFGSPFPATIPAIHQFAAKFTQDAVPSALHQNQDNTGNSNRYTANGVPSFTQHHPATQQQQQQIKYQSGGYVNQGLYGGHHAGLRQDKRQPYDQELAQELCAAMLQHQHQDKHVSLEKTKQETSQPTPLPQQTTGMPSAWQSLATPGSTVADYLSHLPASTLPLSLHHFLKYSAGSIKKEAAQQVSHQGGDLGGLHGVTSGVNGLGGGSMGGNGGLGVNTNGLGSNIVNSLNTLSSNVNVGQLQASSTGIAPPKKKKKKKPEKEKKPRPKPGEIRLTTALDGSTLFCCPECHMAYPEKELLEEHLVGHTLERRFVCDICGAGLKRKDHLTRHKQSHNPERPYVCTVCLKAFKRKEQLTLHFVIHSGEKRHICSECGKGFYRKDHLRKHTRSHIARRVKAELSQQGPVGVPAAHSQGVIS